MKKKITSLLGEEDAFSGWWNWPKREMGETKYMKPATYYRFCDVPLLKIRDVIYTTLAIITWDEQEIHVDYAS